MANKYFNMSLVNGEPTIYLYQPIGDDEFGGSTTPQMIADELKQYAPNAPVTVRINSPGGSVTDGLAIYNLLNQRPGKVVCVIDGLAASMASVVAMSADELQMPKGSYLMIHNPWTVSMGDSKQLIKDAATLDSMRDTLAKIYSFKTGKDMQEVMQVMDNETWIDGETAVAQGWADTLVDEMVAVASLKKNDLSKFNKIDAKLKEIMEKHEEIKDAKAEVKPVDNVVEAPVAQTVTVEVNVEVADDSADVTEPTVEPTEAPDMPMEDATEEDPFSILEAKIKELAQENEQLKAKLQETLTQIGEANKVAEESKSKFADVSAQLSVKTEALNAVTIDREAKAKSLKDLQVKHAKAIAGFKFVPEVTMTWSEALAKANGDYVKARSTYPEVFEKMMSNRQKK